MLENNLFSLHIDALGIFKLGTTNEERVQRFKGMVKDYFLDNGSTVLIPSYSYSYTKKEVYDMRSTKSDVGYVTECLRDSWSDTRTADPLFSYVVSGDGLSGDYCSPGDYECFGENSLMA